MNNNLIIQSQVNKILIGGLNNKINGLDRNCLIDEIAIKGSLNNINLNQNCSNVKKQISGFQNKFRINGNDINNNNNNANAAANRNLNNNMRMRNNAPGLSEGSPLRPPEQGKRGFCRHSLSRRCT